jgi:hypothetical protein
LMPSAGKPSKFNNRIGNRDLHPQLALAARCLTAQPAFGGRTS